MALSGSPPSRVAPGAAAGKATRFKPAAPAAVDPMNEALLKMDYRKLESQEAKDAADMKMKEKVTAAAHRVPAKPPGVAPGIDPTATPIQARLIERKMAQEAARTAPTFAPKGPGGVPLLPGQTLKTSSQLSMPSTASTVELAQPSFGDRYSRRQRHGGAASRVVTCAVAVLMPMRTIDVRFSSLVPLQPLQALAVVCD